MYKKLKLKVNLYIFIYSYQSNLDDGVLNHSNIDFETAKRNIYFM